MKRKAEDKLREEYFEILAELKTAKENLESNIKYHLLPILHKLKSYERYEVVSRIKDCDSAVESLRRRQEGGLFDEEKYNDYSLKDLKDLVGVRILVFPRGLLKDVNNIILKKYDKWEKDPVPGFNDSDEPLALKYFGQISGSDFTTEIQIVPMLTGLFWEVEHTAIYKPKPEFKGVVSSYEMREKTQNVINKLKEFEETFEKLVSDKFT